jgi:ERCC4-type nuclease
MSGTETLIPYLEGRKKGERQPVVIVDSREANASPKIIKGLREAGAEVQIKALQKGDYVISDVCAVERKTVKDFVYTLTRRYLFEQLFTLKEIYPIPIILLEGYLPIVYKFTRIQPSAVWGAMFALAKNGIPMVHTTSYKETVDFLYTAARQEQLVEKRSVVVHPVKKFETLADAQIFFVASLPQIGREKAVAILKSYQTPMNAMLNVDTWAKNVHGLGPKTVKKVKKVLHTAFGR